MKTKKTIPPVKADFQSVINAIADGAGRRAKKPKKSAKKSSAQ